MDFCTDVGCVGVSVGDERLIRFDIVVSSLFSSSDSGGMLVISSAVELNAGSSINREWSVSGRGGDRKLGSTAGCLLFSSSLMSN